MNKTLKKALIIGVLALGAISWAYFGFKMYELKSHRGMPAWRTYLGTHRHRPVSISDVAYIAPWMTFDYITKIFMLPPSYLADNLKIQNPKYPFITISQYAKYTNTNNSVLIESVKSSVEKYLISSTTRQ